MFQVVLPAMYFIPGSGINGSYENSLDALYQIGNSPRLLVFCLLYLVSIAFYNYFGLAVTKSLTGKLIESTSATKEQVLKRELLFIFGSKIIEWGTDDNSAFTARCLFIIFGNVSLCIMQSLNFGVLLCIIDCNWLNNQGALEELWLEVLLFFVFLFFLLCRR